MATKKYTFLFTLADGTTHSIPIEIPTGDDGGYYLPEITQVSDSEIEITFVPSVAGMPSVDSVRMKLQNSGGNVDFKTDETLTLKDGILSVNTTDLMEQDNTLPITSAGVYTTVGNIEALLKTI